MQIIVSIYNGLMVIMRRVDSRRTCFASPGNDDLYPVMPRPVRAVGHLNLFIQIQDLLR